MTRALVSSIVATAVLYAPLRYITSDIRSDLFAVIATAALAILLAWAFQEPAK